MRRCAGEWDSWLTDDASGPQPASRGSRENRGHLEATPSVVSGRAVWYAARRERHRSHCQQVPLPLESQLRMETITADEPKLWNQDTPGHSLPKEMLREVFCPPAALQGIAGAARLGTGETDILVVASFFAPSSTKKCGETAKRLCSWVESIYDKHDKRTMLLWMTDADGDFGLDRRRKNGDHQSKRSGWHQAKRRKQ